MLLSQYFIPTLKENPQDATIASHRLMIRSGMIRQIASGIYTWLPFGLQVLNNISDKIRIGMNDIGAIETLMSCIQPADLWEKSGRYDAYGSEMLRITDRHNHKMIFGPTNEEVITELFKNNIKTYKELPKNFYQIQWKFRDEIRPRFGVMRGREFLMKDAYSFDIDYDSAKKTYDKIYKAYFSIFKSLGLSAVAVKADTGAIGGDLSHEFHIIANTGESKIYYDSEYEKLAKSDDIDIDRLYKLYAAAEEKHDHNISDKNLVLNRGIEVGHIFYFGNKYSKSLGASILDNKGKQIYPMMGSYGIGVSRLVAAIIEANHDDYGIIWPKEISPFIVSIINLKIKDDDCNKLSRNIYDMLKSNNMSVLYDDTDDSAGSKFANHDLIGIPYHIIINPSLAKSDIVILKDRKSGQKSEMSIDSAINQIMKK